ncbi:mitogen-activated protein kinase kinase kinase BCK1 [Sporobolomyces koalae]|uniref:mitogen-activated protein kinase kinase kinase BCK1 n=1 Tax=Sporobolomyces koalae TaxID=500713 RepID=UPI003170FA72
MSQQAYYYSGNRPLYPQTSASSSSSSTYPVRPLPTPGSSPSLNSPYSPPTSATSSKSLPAVSGATSQSGSRFTPGGKVQSPEAIEDSQRSHHGWGSPTNLLSSNGRGPASASGSASGSGSGSGFARPNASNHHTNPTSPNAYGGFEVTSRGSGGHRERNEGSNGSVSRSAGLEISRRSTDLSSPVQIVSPSIGVHQPRSPNNASHYHHEQSHSANSSISSQNRHYPSSSTTPQPSAPPRASSGSPSSPSHGPSHSPSTSRSPLRRSNASAHREPLPAGTLITATADHESLSVVPLSGLSSVEAIKDLIMSRLHISDEDMPRQDFYLTRIGGGEGRRVDDDELWHAVRANSGQVTVFVKDSGARGGRGSDAARRDFSEDSEDDFGVGMSAERMRQVAQRKERIRQKSSSIGSRSETSIDEFGQPTGQRVSPGGTDKLRSDRPQWTHQSASWGHSSRGVSASEGAAGAAGAFSPAASPVMERTRSGGSVMPREREISGSRRAPGVSPSSGFGNVPRDDYFPPVHRQTAPPLVSQHQAHGSNQVVMGPSGPTRRLPPQPQSSMLDLPDHAEMTAHNQLRQRMQTAPSIQVSSPHSSRALSVPAPSDLPLPPSPQPTSVHQMLTRPPGPGTSPNARPSYDPRSNLPQYQSQPYKNLPLPNSPYHNLSLQSSYQPGSSTVGITYTQHPKSASSTSNSPYNVQQHERLALQQQQQKLLSKSVDNLRGHYSTSPQPPAGFDHDRPPTLPPIPPQYRSTPGSDASPSHSAAAVASNSSLGLPTPPPASAFYSSPVQAQHQARSYASPALPPVNQTGVPRRPSADQVWNQPRPSTMYDLSTGQIDLKPGEILQQTSSGRGGSPSGTSSRRRSDLLPFDDFASNKVDSRRESSGSVASSMGASSGDGRRKSRDDPLKSHWPSSVLAGGGGGANRPASIPSPTSHSPDSPSVPPFADDDGLYDGLASPDRYHPSSSTRSSASASGPLTPSGDPGSLISIPTSKSLAHRGPQLDEFGDPIDEETSTWFPVGHIQPQLSTSLPSAGHPSPFSPSVHSPLAQSSTVSPLPIVPSPNGGSSSPMKQQYSSMSTSSTATSAQGGGSIRSGHERERGDSIPNAQDWQQTILSRFGASNLSDANEDSTLMASGTLRPFDSTTSTLRDGSNVSEPVASIPTTPKLVDEFGDELEDDATFFPGFGPSGAPSTPQSYSLRLEGMHSPASPTSPHQKRPNLRVTIEGSPAGASATESRPANKTLTSTQQTVPRSAEASPPLGPRSARKPHNPRLEELVRFASPAISRRNSFAAREEDEKDWAIRPPVETVLENLDVFFPEHDLDKPVFDLPTPSPGTPSTGSSPIREIPPSSRTHRGGSTGTPTGPLGYRKSIRVVAQDRKRMLQKAGNNVARAVSGLGSNLLRRRSTKLFGARIEEVTSAQMKDINAIKEISGDDPDNFSYKWIKGDLIGRGTYGHVYIALSVTTGETIAVKQVEMPRTYSDKEDQRTKGMISSLKAEIELLKDLDHPNIVLYLGMEQTHEFLSIFLEYVPGGSVGRIIRTHGKFEENVIKFFTLQILEGLEYLHSLGILHRDMKADNILIDQDGMCKISDFGTSKKSGDIYQNNENMSMQGSIFWMAPEVIHNNKQGYSAKADIWSLGCICIEMLAGSRPWEGEGFMGAMFKLGAERMRPPLPDDVERSVFAEQFVSNCLQIEPDRRPKASEAKHHPFLVIPPGWSFTQTSLYYVMTSDRLPSTPSAASSG